VAYLPSAGQPNLDDPIHERWAGLRDLIVYLPVIGRHRVMDGFSGADWDLRVLYTVFLRLAGKYYFMEE
jgi:hypothetical protein